MPICWMHFFYTKDIISIKVHEFGWYWFMGCVYVIRRNDGWQSCKYVLYSTLKVKYLLSLHYNTVLHKPIMYNKVKVSQIFRFYNYCKICLAVNSNPISFSVGHLNFIFSIRIYYYVGLGLELNTFDFVCKSWLWAYQPAS